MFGLLLTQSACSTTPADPTADGRLVFCLAPSQRENLTNAAVAIGPAQPAPTPGRLVVDGVNLSVEQWRARYGADFDRACDALISAARTTDAGAAGGGSADSGLLSDVRSVLLLVAGAVVSLLSGSVKYGIDRRRLQASQLSSAEQRFVTGYRDYRAERRGGSSPDIGPVREQRQDLVARLRDVLDLYPALAPAKAADAVLTRELDMERLTDDSRRGTQDQETQETVDLALNRFHAEIDSTIRRLRHPVRGRWGGSS